MEADTQIQRQTQKYKYTKTQNITIISITVEALFATKNQDIKKQIYKVLGGFERFLRSSQCAHWKYLVVQLRILLNSGLPKWRHLKWCFWESFPAFPRWTHLIFQSFKSSPRWSASLPQRCFLVGTRRADDCRKKSAIWSSASLLKADKCYKNLSSNPTGDGYQAVNQTLSSEMSWKSFHLRNILNRYLRDILNRHLRNILTWGEEAFTLSPLQQHFLSLVSSGLLRSQLTFWLSLLETTGLRTPIIFGSAM